MDFIERYKAAVRVSTPLIAIATQDQQATFRTLAAVHPKRPTLMWDFMQGVTAFNAEGEAEKLRIIKKMQIDKAALTVPKVMLEFAAELVDRSMLWIFNAHNYLPGNPPRITDGTLAFVQGLWNLREPNKEKARMTGLLGPGWVLPDELKVDVLQLEQPLPTLGELEGIVKEEHEAWNNSKKPTEELPALAAPLLRDAVDALRGIESIAAAGQIIAMSLSPKGLDVPEVWNRKRAQVNSAPGLMWYNGTETLNDICGYEVVSKWHLRMLQSERKKILTLIFEDEFEKFWRTKGGGDSGVSDDMLGMKLTTMQEKGYSGSIFVGHSGSGKTILAKALGGTIGKPFIFLDMSRMKEGLVGASTKRQAQAYKIIEAISDGNAYFIATSNGLSGIPPELLRRYKGGIWMFDLPTAEEREKMWRLYLKKYDLDIKEGQKPVLPDDTDWTGSEIQKCCEMAWLMDMPLKEAAKSVIPVAVSNRKQIEELREIANGTYLSASYEGEYQKDRQAPPAKRGGRQFQA